MQTHSAKRDNKKHLHFHSADGAPTTLSTTFARNFRRIRGERGYSLEMLATLADVDLPALDQVDTGKGEPTLEFAWRIANALEVPFAALIADQAPRGSVVIRKSKASLIVSEDLGLTTRALFPSLQDQGVEFYELRLAPHHHEISDPHRPGTAEILFVAQGDLEVTVGREPAHLVNRGDTIYFPADLPHSYRNLTSNPATLYLVMTYPEAARSGVT
jgi:quercetin dioxygenase-like cupin family protein/DNA-binding XRE family transcriptional regulator